MRLPSLDFTFLSPVNRLCKVSPSKGHEYRWNHVDDVLDQPCQFLSPCSWFYLQMISEYCTRMALCGRQECRRTGYVGVCAEIIGAFARPVDISFVPL